MAELEEASYGFASPLNASDVASQHGVCRAEPRNCCRHGVNVVGVLALVVEKSLSALIISDTGNVTVALVVFVDVQLAHQVSARLH